MPRAIVFREPFRIEIREFDLPSPGTGQVLIESVYSCVSPGTELRRLEGHESLGDVRFPFIPGYCLAGRVLASGPGVGLEKGTPVITCGTVEAGGLGLGEGGHSSHALAPVETVVEAPAGVSLLDASVAILGGIAYHGYLQSKPKAGEKVAVVGLGVIGQLAGRLHALSGAEVVGCDLSEPRAECARRAGMKVVDATPSVTAAFREVFPDGADIVVDSTGVPGVVAEAMKIVRKKPWSPSYDSGCCRYLIQGSYEGLFGVPYPDAYAGQVAILIPKGSQASDWKAALELIGQGRLRVGDLVTEVRAPEEAPDVYSEFRRPGAKIITAVFQWGQ